MLLNSFVSLLSNFHFFISLPKFLSNGGTYAPKFICGPLSNCLSLTGYKSENRIKKKTKLNKRCRLEVVVFFYDKNKAECERVRVFKQRKK